MSNIAGERDGIYWDGGHIRGRCSVCFDQKQHRAKPGSKWFKPWYFRVYEKVDIFRGNDEYLGMICKQCIKDGNLKAVNKYHPNQMKDEAPSQKPGRKTE